MQFSVRHNEGMGNRLKEIKSLFKFSEVFFLLLNYTVKPGYLCWFHYIFTHVLLLQLDHSITLTHTHLITHSAK